MQIPFENTLNCEKCHQKYDEWFFECPRCHSENVLGKEDSKKHPFKYLPNFMNISLFLVGWLLLQILVLVLSLILIKDKTNIYNDPIIVYIEFGSYIGGIILMFCIMWRYIQYLPREFKNLKSYFAGAIAFLIICGFSYFWNIFLTSCGVNVATNSNQQALITMLKENPTIMFFVIVILGPISEELTYRVGLFSAFKHFKPWIAYIVSIGFFTLIHINFAGDIVSELASLPIYLCGATVLTYIFDKYGLSASLLAHVLNNGLMFLATIKGI